LTNVNGTLYFTADNGVNGYKLWKSDGIATTLLSAPNLKRPTGQATASGSNIYFMNSDSINGVELWKSNGTTAGTVLVKDIVSGTSSSAPSSLTNVNGTLYFTANDSVNGQELWKSDGTTAGTVLVKLTLSGSQFPKL
ncbi:MAG: ELWxxDGT repeat protein, partial [Methylococcaceae bacterium]